MKFSRNQPQQAAEHAARNWPMLAYRELDEVLRLTEMGAEVLSDLRPGTNKQHGLVPLLRRSIYSRLAGYEDVNDAERLAVDPAMRHVVGGRAAQADNAAASASGVGRFETEILSHRQNLTALMNISGRWKTLRLAPFPDLSGWKTGKISKSPHAFCSGMRCCYNREGGESRSVPGSTHMGNPGYTS